MFLKPREIHLFSRVANIHCSVVLQLHSCQRGEINFTKHCKFPGPTFHGTSSELLQPSSQFHYYYFLGFEDGVLLQITVVAAEIVS